MAFQEPDVEAVLNAPAAWFNGWRTYYEIEPWGGERGDLQAAYIGAAAMAPHTKNGNAPRIGTFLPSFKLMAAPRQSMEEQKAIFAQSKASFEKRIAHDKQRRG